MFLFIYIGVIMITYIVSFKDDFTKEYIEKAEPFIFIVSAILILAGIGSSIR